jgi:uroporphyrin-3 C-methyltransferase
MTETEQANEGPVPQDDDTAPEATRAPRGPSGAVAWLALLLGLVGIAAALGVGAWVYLLERAELEQAAARGAELANLAERVDRLQDRAEIDALTRELRTARDALAAEDRRLAGELAAVTDSIAAVHTLATRGQRGWVLAEVEFLMRIAQDRLRLMRDLDGASAALEAADARLHELADPRLLPVREALADEVQALAQVQRPDVVGIALKLDRLISGLKPLPLAQALPEPATAAPAADEAAAPEEAGKSLSDLFETVGARLSEHIKVRRHETPIEALPDAQTELHLHQLLRLRLEAARLALLRDDPATYRGQLDSAVGLIDAYYSPDAVQGLRETLGELREAELRPALPDLSTSYTRLQERARPRAGDEAGESAP